MKIKPTKSEAEHRLRLYNPIAYDLVKTTLSESDAEAEE